MKFNPKRSSLPRIVVCVGLLFGGILIVSMLGHQSSEITLGNGVVIRITNPSTFAAFCTGASCKIDCRTKGGQIGIINLLRDSDSSLAIVMPTTNGNGLLLLYDADVHYRLMRVDFNKRSVAFQGGSYLKYIVQSSPWSVEEGASNDWEEACAYLKSVPQSVFNRQATTTYLFGVFGFQYKRSEILAEVNREIYNSQHGLVY